MSKDSFDSALKAVRRMGSKPMNMEEFLEELKAMTERANQAESLETMPPAGSC